ncbi:MAG TPA: hypothetical protein VMC44_00060 [Geobacteraceae bacterium]|nr:hypothetical protein [Geobacteraceae bacterium]
MRAVLILLATLVFISGVSGFNAGEVEESALSGFKQILDLWRSENYDGLYARLTHPPNRGWDYFASRIVYASRIPACCWEQLQKVTSVATGPDQAVINATVGMEVEGVGTRFVTRDFVLKRIDGEWKLPMQDILYLSDYNQQRIPRKIYEREIGHSF